MTFSKAIKKVSKFNTVQSAERFANRCVKAQVVLLGDDNLYWVAPLGIGDWLVKNGYSAVN